MLGAACQVLSERCIAGITANREHCRRMVERSIGLVTALNPVLGYERSTEIAQELWKRVVGVWIVLAKATWKSWMTAQARTARPAYDCDQNECGSATNLRMVS
jgi:aspartate ammonia-lyase